MIGLTRRHALTGGAIAVAVASLGLGPRRGLGAPPERIVSVGGSLTEIVFALGAGDRIVGVDTTSIWPPMAEQIDKVGYLRHLSAEGVLSLKPDLVLLAANAGPPTAIEQLESAGTRLAMAPDGADLESISAKIRFVGAAIGRQKQSEALVARFERDIATVNAKLAQVPSRPRVLFLISLSRGAPIAAGGETKAEAIIALARGRNAVTGFTGYKPLSAEALIAAAPEVVLLPHHVAEGAGGAEAVAERPDLAATPAGRDARIVVMDTLKLLGFGLRTPEAIAELARALHPDQASTIAL